MEGVLGNKNKGNEKENKTQTKKREFCPSVATWLLGK
jgi:hypothetical protein